DDQMGDVDVLRPQFARGSLRHGAEAEFGAGKSRVTNAAAQRSRRAGKKDGAAATWQHATRSLTSRQKSRIASHLPALAQNTIGRVQQRKIDVGADVEDADFERSVLVRIGQERNNLFLLACVE